MQWSHIKRNGAYRDKASEHERRASKLLPMSSVTHPLIHGQEASGMEAALTPWFHRYDIMMDHCCSFTLPLIIPKYPGIRNCPLMPGYWFLAQSHSGGRFIFRTVESVSIPIAP